jgi:hypothetical protein
MDFKNEQKVVFIKPIAKGEVIEWYNSPTGEGGFFMKNGKMGWERVSKPINIPLPIKVVNKC